MIESEQDLINAIEKISEEHEKEFEDGGLQMKRGSSDYPHNMSNKELLDDLFNISNIVLNNSKMEDVDEVDDNTNNITDNIEINNLLTQFYKSDAKNLKDLLNQFK